MTASGQESQRSITPTFPVPQRHGTEPSVSSTPPTMYPLRPIQSAPAFPSPQPPFQLLGHLASSNLQQDSNDAKLKALFESLVYPEGEIPVSVSSVDNARLTNGYVFQVFDKDDADSWRLIRIEPVVTRKRISISWWKIWKLFSSRTLWTDAHCILLDGQCT